MSVISSEAQSRNLNRTYMQDLSLLTEYMSGEWSADDFCAILLSDEGLCERVRIAYAEATRRDVDVVSQIASIKPNSPTADLFLCGIISQILDHKGIEYDKKRKVAAQKRIKKSYLEKEKRDGLSNLPMSKKLFFKLFDRLGARLSERGCNHTLDITTEFLNENGVDVQCVLDWLADHGGGCDCEVLYNTEEYFE